MAELVHGTVFEAKDRISQPYPNWVRMGFPGSSLGKESTYSAGDTGDADSIPGFGRSLGGGHGNPLQYSCLENSMDRRAWQATAYRVTESWT